MPGEQCCQRNALAHSGQRPDPHLECGNGHAVTTNAGTQTGVGILRTGQLQVSKPERKPFRYGKPAGVHRVGSIGRQRLRNALAPRRVAIPVGEFEQEYTTLVHVATGGPEWLNERQPDFAQCYALYGDHLANCRVPERSFTARRVGGSVLSPDNMFNLSGSCARLATVPGPCSPYSPLAR